MAKSRSAARSKGRLAVILTDQVQVDVRDPEFLGRNRDARASIEYVLAQELQALGHRTKVVPYGPDPDQFIQRITELSPYLVFNLTEEVGGNRLFDANVASLLQLLHLRFTGAGPRGLTLGRDKAVSKVLLRDVGLKVPPFCVVPPGGSVATSEMPPFPAVVKPVFGDGSDGISTSSLVRTPRQLRARASVIHRRYRQAAICEQYIDGREFLAFAVGNKRLHFLPTVEITWRKRSYGAPRLASYLIKHDMDHRRRAGMSYKTAVLTPAERRQLERVTTTAYNTLEMRDYGKVDVIMDRRGDMYVIEGNPNPCLLSKARSLGRWKTGYTFRDLVSHIVHEAVARGAK
jgi:D-alanine-D-alanine ligase